jgi:pyridoxine kinase
MARVLVISSQVARGHVGLSAIVPALNRLGHEVIALPTIILSNHPGHAHFSGQHVSPALLERMLDSIEANGWLEEVAAVVTGYFPTLDHVLFAAEAIRRINARAPGSLNVCDPVFGDDPEGNYVEIDIATSIRDVLLPMCDLATPNRFELAWLAAQPVGDRDDAITAARTLPVNQVLCTSIPVPADRLATVLVSADAVASCSVRRRQRVPQGTGDLLTALFVGHRLDGRSDPEALGKAVAGVNATITASEHTDELAIAASQNQWPHVRALAVEKSGEK